MQLNDAIRELGLGPSDYKAGSARAQTQEHAGDTTMHVPDKPDLTNVEQAQTQELKTERLALFPTQRTAYDFSQKCSQATAGCGWRMCRTSSQ